MVVWRSARSPALAAEAADVLLRRALPAAGRTMPHVDAALQGSGAHQHAFCQRFGNTVYPHGVLVQAGAASACPPC